MSFTDIDIPGGCAVIHTAPDLGGDPNYLFHHLYNDTPWEQRCVVIYGIEHLQPRLIAWYGNHSYTYSGLRLEPRPLTPLLENTKAAMEALTGASYNGVLLNLYQDGKSSIGMHSDDEPEFGKDPVIASLSLGDERIFSFQRKDKSLPIVKIPLTDGSVLVMSGKTQELWKHGVAKTKFLVGPRINLTFRNVID